jgi:hypothetical protein
MTYDLPLRNALGPNRRALRRVNMAEFVRGPGEVAGRVRLEWKRRRTLAIRRAFGFPLPDARPSWRDHSDRSLAADACFASCVCSAFEELGFHPEKPTLDAAEVIIPGVRNAN